MSTCPSLIYPERPLHLVSTIDFFLFSFQQLANPSFRKSFVFSSIQNPGGCHPPVPQRSNVRTFKRSNSFAFMYFQPLCLICKTQVLSFQRNPASFPKRPGVGARTSFGQGRVAQALLPVLRRKQLERRSTTPNRTTPPNPCRFSTTFGRFNAQTIFQRSDERRTDGNRIAC